MPYADPGNDFPPSTYGAAGPSRGAMAGLGGAARRQAKPTHVKVPLSTLIGLLLADAVQPVAPARPRTPQSMLPGLANRIQHPTQGVSSLASLIQPQPRTAPMRRPLGRYQNF